MLYPIFFGLCCVEKKQRVGWRWRKIWEMFWRLFENFVQSLIAQVEFLCHKEKRTNVKMVEIWGGLSFLQKRVVFSARLASLCTEECGSLEGGVMMPLLWRRHIVRWGRKNSIHTSFTKSEKSSEESCQRAYSRQAKYLIPVFRRSDAFQFVIIPRIISYPSHRLSRKTNVKTFFFGCDIVCEVLCSAQKKAKKEAIINLNFDKSLLSKYRSQADTPNLNSIVLLRCTLATVKKWSLISCTAGQATLKVFLGFHFSRYSWRSIGIRNTEFIAHWTEFILSEEAGFNDETTNNETYIQM